MGIRATGLTRCIYTDMGVEIERTFLVHTDKLPKLGEPVVIEQAYLSDDPCVRVRLMTRSGVSIAFLTIKGHGTIERAEFEWEIPVKDAEQILSQGLWDTALVKKRYTLGRWEVDAFDGGLEGLWLAEIELKSADEEFDKPKWLGKEVSDDPAFTNVVLAREGDYPIDEVPP